ncbi:MAG: DUF2330 domain-containing protein [Myxococcota bacterium]|nr:DUF2330 domain-containing protein [Myxococcota bacterium]
MQRFLRKKARWLTVMISGAACLLAGGNAQAFCGFYVAGGESSLFNDATQVVLMRDGTKTVLSMQNNYKGPPENFAMVTPVPQVLQQENVKTLSPDVFKKIDTLTAPRLVEYWEKDPCEPEYMERDGVMMATADSAGGVPESAVQIEAQFEVGEYEIVVLSTGDSTALETWLVDNQYNIPSGADTYFEPYVESGMYFFVAKVKTEKVTMEDGRAVLSPLRFHYDSTEFSLPIRLGLINSSGSQDLIVYTLGKNQRYDVANRENLTIPTNIEVINDVRNSFGEFYRTLFAETIAQNPGAAVTEYSWDAGSCDPCPGPTLNQEDYMTFGADVLNSDDSMWASWVVTRLHVRYDSNTIGDDLVFRAAPPIAGGRERYTSPNLLETGSISSNVNNFQGRYIIRHPWEGPVECDDPGTDRRWGGQGGSDSVSAQAAVSPNSGGVAPPAANQSDTSNTESSNTNTGTDTSEGTDTSNTESSNTNTGTDTSNTGNGAQTQSPSKLPSNDLKDLVYDEIPELNVIPTATSPALIAPEATGCACSSSDTAAGSGILLLTFGMTYYWVYRRRRIFERV